MIKFMIAFLCIIHALAQIYETGGIKVNKTNENLYTINDNKKQLIIPSECKKVKVYDPTLNSKSDPSNPYFLMAITCTDMIRAEDYYLAKKNNSYKELAPDNMTGVDLIKYQCVMNVTFDNNEHCCCPVRNYDFQSITQKQQL